MEFRGMRLGAVLVPLGVAIIPVSVLIWYGFVRIPAQENYLNERNLRLLTTLSGPLKTKVDSFDGALEHAVNSFEIEDIESGDARSRALRQPVRLEKFKQGVLLFARDLEVLEVMTSQPPKAAANSDIVAEMLEGAADPPRVRIERDEGRYYLYLGAKLKSAADKDVWVVAKSDIEQLVKPFLEASQEFAAVLLATENGEVIAQKSPVGLSLARVGDGVINSRSTPTKDRSAPPATFGSLSEFSNMVPVTIGQVDYKLYLQPVPLSLLSMPTGKESAGSARHSEQWVLCGLVRADRFRADSSSISYTMLLWFSGLLAAIALAIPFVKLRALSSRERLRASDVGWVMATTFMAIGLLTLGVLDVYTFGGRFGRTVDERLKAVADQIKENLQKEFKAIDEQEEKFEIRLADGFSGVSERLRKQHVAAPTLVVTLNGDRNGASVSCRQEGACESNVLDWLLPGQTAQTAYPYFVLVSWTGEDGWQRVRWTPGPGIRPFVNIKDEKLPYYPDVRRAWLLQAASGLQSHGVSVLESPTTGEPLTIFWRTGPARPIKSVQVLATSSPVALDQPMLPKGVSFAVVDRGGRVLFHSDRNRRLKENFLKECEDDAEVQAAVQDGSSPPLSAHYLGRPQRLYVTALMESTLGDSPWRLAVFQDSAVAETVNLETLTIASWLFAMYGGVLALAAAVLRAFAHQEWSKWFWPDASKALAYRSAALLNGAAIVVFIGVSALLHSPSGLLIATAALAIATAAATHRIVVRGVKTSGASGALGLWHPFFWARAAFLLVVAGLPAIACFQAAYDFETTLLARSESAQHTRDLMARPDRIIRNVELLNLRSPETVRRYIDARRKLDWDTNTYVRLWSALSDSPADATGSRILDSALHWMHRPYNEIAIHLASADDKQAEDKDLAASKDQAQAPSTAVTAGWLVAIVGALFAACYAFVYWLVKPIFVLDVVAPPIRPRDRAETASGHVLVVGPPGSGKSTELARDREIRIFDLATLAYVERRKQALTVDFERRRAAGASGGGWGWMWGAPSGRATPAANAPEAAGWADAFDYSRLPTVLGIDHLDHRLEERDFAAQTLKFLEHAIYREGCRVLLVSDRDPLVCVRDGGAPPADVDRWARALQSCRKETVGIGCHASAGPVGVPDDRAAMGWRVPEVVAQAVREECQDAPRLVRIADDVLRSLNESTSVEDALAAFGSAAEPYYEALWRACTVDERLALRQLAEEGLVNPQNQPVARELMRAGLIVRDPVVRVMNNTFRGFVLRAASPDQVSAWEHRGVLIPWGSIEVAMMTVVVGLAGLLVITQEQLLNAWIGFVPTLMPAAQKLWKVFVAVRPATKGELAA